MEFRGELRVLSPEIVASLEVLDPTLPEDEEHVVPRLYGPPHAALETEICRPIVELDQVREREEGRNRIVDLCAVDSGYEMALRRLAKV